jgi:hypothetical protein
MRPFEKCRALMPAPGSLFVSALIFTAHAGWGLMFD